MRGGAGAQRGEVITAFEGGDEAPGTVARRLAGKGLRHPAVIRLGEVELGERVAAMGIEPGRDEEEIGAEILEGRQDALLQPALGQVKMQIESGFH